MSTQRGSPGCTKSEELKARLIGCTLFGDPVIRTIVFGGSRMGFPYFMEITTHDMKKIEPMGWGCFTNF